MYHFNNIYNVKQLWLIESVRHGKSRRQIEENIKQWRISAILLKKLAISDCNKGDEGLRGVDVSLSYHMSVVPNSQYCNVAIIGI